MLARRCPEQASNQHRRIIVAIFGKIRRKEEAWDNLSGVVYVSLVSWARSVVSRCSSEPDTAL